MIMRNSVRPLVEADLKAILAIENQCYPIPWTADHFRHELTNPVASLVGCDVDNSLSGYICYWLIAGEMEILNVAVDPLYQRRGIAGILIENAFHHCQSKGLDSAWLEVRAGNKAAIGLYEQFGFVVNGQRQRYYRDGEDALLMMRMFEHP
jgi:[ribosomal protein S18]-alanine N-acetyltransferase